MRIKLPIDASNLEPGSQEFVSFTSQIVNQILTVLNGEVSLIDNCKSQQILVVFNAANVEQAVPHGLGNIPKGYFQVGALAAAQVYNGLTKNTTQALYVRSSVATTVSLLVFS